MKITWHESVFCLLVSRHGCQPRQSSSTVPDQQSQTHQQVLPLLHTNFITLNLLDTSKLFLLLFSFIYICSVQNLSRQPWPDNGCPAHIPAPSSLEQQPLCFAQKVSSNFHNDNKPKPNCCLDKYSVKMQQINWSLQNMNYKINFRNFQSFWMFAGARAWKLHINWIHLFSFWQIWWLARRGEKFSSF